MSKRQNLINKLVQQEEARYALSERRLAHFVRNAWRVLEPKTELRWNWHLDLECETLEAVKSRQIKRLIVNVPPRSLKSTIASVCFPAWYWIGDPSERFLYTSYAQKLSTKHSVDCRTLIESDWYQSAWSDRFKLKDDQNEKMRFENSKRGHRVATSMGGTATGDGGNILGIDDPHDTTIANSKEKLTTSLEDYDQKFTSRLNDKETGAIIIIMQRLNERDLTGHVLAKELGWHHLKLPAISERSERLVFPISGKVLEREPDDVLHPARESKAVHEATKISMGSRAFAGQYQQAPAPAEGAIILREWVRFYHRKDIAELCFDETIDSWDLTFKDTANADFVAAQRWSRYGANLYLRKRLKKRLDFPATIKAFKSWNDDPKVRARLIEDKANGPAVISTLKAEISCIVPVIPEGNKEERVSAIAPMWEAGNVLLPHPDEEPWVLELIEEIVGFPAMANDDEVDAMSQALWRLKISSGARLQKLVTL